MSPIYHSLHFVLLFPTGQLSWHPKLTFGDPVEDEDHESEDDEEGAERLLAPGEEPDEQESEEIVEVRKKKRKYMSQAEFIRYRLFCRENESDHLFRAQHLFQEYIVDCWASAKQSRLGWLSRNC